MQTSTHTQSERQVIGAAAVSTVSREQSDVKPGLHDPQQQTFRSVAGVATSESHIKFLFRIIGILLGLAQTIVARNSIGPDGRSYMEIARAYLGHDWRMTVNAHWSPLYSWLSAVMLGIVRPSWRWEYPTVHAMNFLIFLVAIAAFEFFWKGLPRSESGIPNLEFWVLGYAFFLWLTVAQLSLVNPDLCVATMVYFIMGLVMRVRNQGRTVTHIWLGGALAFGYFAKAILFPLAFVFLAVLVISRVNTKKIVLSSAIFLAIAAPQILRLSRAEGHITWSESGRLTLAWSNWDVPIRNWQGQPPGNGTPVHPTRQVYLHPAVFEFNGPIRASYPPWYDPTYWNEGLKFNFVPRVLVAHATHNAAQILVGFLQPKIWVLAMVTLLVLSTRASFMGIAAQWFLLVPALAAFSLYSLMFAEFRYMPAWEMLVWAALLSGLRMRRRAPRVVSWIAAGSAAIMLLASANGSRGQFAHGRHDDATPVYAIVEGLQHLRVQPGARVGAIGYDTDAHWAYLSRLSVVAEINADQTCEFWSANPKIQQEVLEKFRVAGASLLVAHVGGGMRPTSYAHPPDLASCTQPRTGWQKLSPSSDLVYFLH